MADHNDTNAVNSILSDIDVSAADLYDIFGFPVGAGADGDKIVIALTFAAVPGAGVLDPDILYRILEDGSAAIEWAGRDLRLRENFAKQTALAWAFYVDGQAGEAVHWIERALAAGAVSALLLYRAGEIYAAAGDTRRGRG